ncbi:MAG: ribosome maturation factor RimP [Bacteroidota bacterium]
MNQTSTDSLTDALRVLAEQAVAEAAQDVYLVDVDVRGFQGSRVVSVYVDADDGIDLDATAAVSRALSAALDRDDLVKGRYRLDVSSPGADRPLTRVRQMPRHVGRTLAVTYTSDDATSGGVAVVTTTGVLTAADASAIALDVPGTDAVLSIPADRFIEATVQLPW